jgi:voltage-gated potassium channel
VAYSPPRGFPIRLRLLVYCSVPALLIGAGTVGYRLLERWFWFDSFYVAVITLTSIGYGERSPVTIPGRVFTLGLALGGIFTVALAATELLSTIVTGELREYRVKRRIAKRINALDRHVIVCGYGHVGQHVCAELLGGGVSVVVIDRQDGPLEAASDTGVHPVHGDATDDATLRRAGIDRARALVSVAGTDGDNVLITIAARLLCPTLPIVSRAEEDATVPKLLRAGATRIVSPHAVAGGRIAQAVLRPAVIDLIEDASRTSRNGHPDLQLQEQLVHPGSPLDGKTVGTSGLRSRLGLIVVAIKHQDGHLAFNPEDHVPVAAGDTLITMGSREQLGRADALAIAR